MGVKSLKHDEDDDDDEDRTRTRDFGTFGF